MSAAPEIVIGSGPAGLAVAHARLARGRAVLILDGGRDLEAAALARRAGLAAQDPEAWDPGTLAAYRSANDGAASDQFLQLLGGKLTLVRHDRSAIRMARPDFARENIHGLPEGIVTEVGRVENDS